MAISDPVPGVESDVDEGPATGTAGDRKGSLIDQLERLHDEMRHQHVVWAESLERVHPCHRQGAANLVDYLTLRRHDIRWLQASLAELGLSSLGRAEEHVIATLERVLAVLYLMTGRPDVRCTEAAVSYGAGRRALETNADALLGPSPPDRSSRILVTMPSEAADDFVLVRALMAHGMECARINCAHDDEERWGRMAAHIRRASRELDQPCPILMDLPGPKLRTGPIEPGPRVVRLRPRRDALGRPVEPARALLVPDEPGPTPVGGPAPAAMLPVRREWLDRLHPGDVIHLRDTRDDRRRLVVTTAAEDGVWVEANDTTYLETGTTLTGPGRHDVRIGSLPALEQTITLRVDDVLTLSADPSPVAPTGDVPRTPLSSTTRSGLAPDVAGLRIGCTLPAALEAVQVGHRVFFDDGKIGGTIIAVRPGAADVRITVARSGGSKLRAEKGINMPDSELRLPALGPDDESLLRFIVGHADLVGLSFAQDVADVAALRRRLEELGGASLGIVLKIETARGFGSLPEILVAGMESERLGVMVARGDLAVECGFERLAELQEEILSLCDAAHIPVIWATQVLDQMAKSGQPSRAEISDAAMSGRAECVMLNKGPHIVQTVTALDDILRRMSSHQQKKVTLLRRLRSWSPEPA
jgi:pyruvate kinase